MSEPKMNYDATRSSEAKTHVVHFMQPQRIRLSCQSPQFYHSMFSHHNEISDATIENLRPSHQTPCKVKQRHALRSTKIKYPQPASGLLFSKNSVHNIHQIGNRDKLSTIAYLVINHANIQNTHSWRNNFGWLTPTILQLHLSASLKTTSNSHVTWGFLMYTFNAAFSIFESTSSSASPPQKLDFWIRLQYLQSVQCQLVQPTQRWCCENVELAGFNFFMNTILCRSQYTKAIT